jgi:hypothetical protein
VEASGDRPHRERRPRRDDRVHEEVAGTSERAAAPHRAEREHAPREHAPRPPRTDAPPARPAAAPRKKLTDRELFELLQSGKPLPPVDDPTTEDRGGGEPRGDGDRERRPRRRERTEERVETAPGHTRLWLNLGRMDNLEEASLLAALGALGAPTAKVARTELRGTYTYLHVADADAPAFEALSGKVHADKEVKVERARR